MKKKTNTLAWVLLILLYMVSIVAYIYRGISGYDWLFVIALVIGLIALFLVYLCNLILSALLAGDDGDDNNEKK